MAGFVPRVLADLLTEHEGTISDFVGLLTKPGAARGFEDTPRSRAEAAQRAAAHRAGVLRWLVPYNRVRDATGGVMRSVAELHSPYLDHQGAGCCVTCTHVDEFGHVHQPWPCATIRVVAEHAGVPLPDDTGKGDGDD